VSLPTFQTRLLGFGVLLLFCFGGTGCRLFGGAKRLNLPKGFEHEPIASRLADPQTRQEAYDELFPYLPKVHITGGRLVASGEQWRGKRRIGFSFFGLDAEHLRLRAYLRTMATPLFDLIVLDERMTVLLNREGHGFSGPIPPQGSPFVRRFGVEPADLLAIFRIGQYLKENPYTESENGKARVLKFEDPAQIGGLVEVELEERSGLPRRARWARDDQSWEVNYRSWQWFTWQSPTDEMEEETRLMPSKLEVRRDDPHTRLDLTVGEYKFGHRIPPQLFILRDTFRYVFHPLDDLDEVLEES